MIPLLRGLLVLVVLALLSLAAFVPFYFVALTRLLVPVRHVRRICARLLVRIAEAWAGGTRACFRALSPTEIRVSYSERADSEGENRSTSEVVPEAHGPLQRLPYVNSAGVGAQREFPATLDRHGHYLVIANHRSWADIFVLLYILHGHVPFPRFFIKRGLAALPFFGLALWALDFPFMRRYSREHLERHPQHRGLDLETTRRSCEKFRRMPVTLVNFVEGTRFSDDRRQAQESPYRNLLRPKSGGLSLALQVMKDQLTAVIDLTLRYPSGPVSFWRFVSGQYRWVEATVQVLPVPGDVSLEATREWLQERWAEKDARLGTDPHPGA